MTKDDIERLEWVRDAIQRARRYIPAELFFARGQLVHAVAMLDDVLDDHKAAVDD